MSQRRITTTSSSLFLTRDMPFYINRVTESFRLEQHKHEFIEINYVSEGSGFQFIEGQTIPVSRGDLFYLPIGASHVFRPTSPVRRQGSLIVYNCLFEQSFALRLAAAFGPDSDIGSWLSTAYPEQPWLHVKDREGRLQPAFQTMFGEYRKQELHFERIIQAEILRVMIVMERTLARAGGEGGADAAVRAARPKADAAMEACLQRIRAQSGEKLTAAGMAAEIGLSERHFRRRFEESAGMTFIEYLHQCRIEKSCELLEATEDKITSVALQAGYHDVKFFNRLFKLKTGQSPRDYRKSRSGIQNENDVEKEAVKY